MFGTTEAEKLVTMYKENADFIAEYDDGNVMKGSLTHDLIKESISKCDRLYDQLVRIGREDAVADIEVPDSVNIKRPTHTKVKVKVRIENEKAFRVWWKEHGHKAFESHLEN